MRAVVRAICVSLISLIAPIAADSATLAGQTVKPGGTIDIRFPVPKFFQDYAAAGGNPRPTTGRALISFPKGFDLARSWPILVVTSTADFNRTSIMDQPWYAEPATHEGWIVLASDATITAQRDTNAWRLGLLGAALEAIRKDWPQSKNWPVAFGGFSGGAKRSGVLGAILASNGAVKVCGFFLGGINSDELSPAYKTYHPSPDFLNVPIWLSGGMEDHIAPYGAHERVRASLVAAGFKRVRLEPFMGGHKLNAAELQSALRWFREVGHF